MPARHSRDQAQISGPRKDEFIRRAISDLAVLDTEIANQVASHLAAVIDVIRADRAVVDRYKEPSFDPNAFSALKVYRNSGEQGLRGKLAEIAEERHLRALAKAQQIILPRRLPRGDGLPSALRDAIVAGVKKRHDDWKAAS